ncbi:MAG: hypothetical protein HKN47_13330 [Pirellulaceae bacterium]|nr:hypothetical protein [Pirellulaceae bacterium]
MKLPKQGKRGCILLSPQKIVAPVGGEVVLLSGICGNDGYLQVGEPLEWMLTPDSVGTFIQVGDDAPGILHRLAKLSKAEKHDPSYAKGVTSTKRTLITRGNLDARDDVQLEKGQTWITLSSPSEGLSRVTVLAPESDCWDNRKATATIYWIDARWQYPSSQIVPAGTPVSLSTRVTRSEGTLPARGWKVRYEIMEPGLAAFAGTNGSSVVEVNVGDDGNATAELIPIEGASGTTPVDIQVIRPGGISDNIPTMTLSRGQTFVTWSAPQLEIEAGAPSVATFNVPVEVVANVRNPGDQPANNVRVTMQIPPGVRATSTDGFAQNIPSAIVWDIDTLPAKTQLDLFATVTAQATTNLVFEARGDNGLIATDSVRIDVYRPSLMLDVQADRDRVEAGEPVTFNIDVKNTGDQPLKEVELVVMGGDNMLDQERGRQGVRKPKDDGPLQPGETWPVAVTYIPTESGRRCVNVTATATGGQNAQAQQCITVINPIPPTPALTAKLDRRDKVEIGGPLAVLRGRVTNTGQVPLNNLRVTMSHDPQLQLIRATTDGLDRSRMGQYLIAWDLPTLAPGDSRVYEAEVRAVGPNPRSQLILTAETAEGATANDSYNFEIVPSLSPSMDPSAGGPATGSNLQPPPLPPVQPSPTIPGGPAPIPDPSGSGAGGPSGPVGPAPNLRSGRLQLSLYARDNPVRVNDPIRYVLTVLNDSDVPDSQIQLRFALPPGVRVERVSQRRSPEMGQFRNEGGGVRALEEIKTMRPGESIDYELVLSSNQPQTIDLTVEGISQQSPNVARANAQVTVDQ